MDKSLGEFATETKKSVCLGFTMYGHTEEIVDILFILFHYFVYSE